MACLESHSLFTKDRELEIGSLTFTSGLILFLRDSGMRVTCSMELKTKCKETEETGLGM